MTADYLEGIDEVFKVFYDAWKTTTTIVDAIPPIHWQGIQEDSIPDSEKFWCRVTQKTLEDDQITINENTAGVRRYGIEGILIIELFCPAEGEDFQKGRQLANLVKEAFKGTTTPLCVRFSKARIDEVGPTRTGYEFNIVVEYHHEYRS